MCVLCKGDKCVWLPGVWEAKCVWKPSVWGTQMGGASKWVREPKVWGSQMCVVSKCSREPKVCEAFKCYIQYWLLLTKFFLTLIILVEESVIHKQK